MRPYGERRGNHRHPICQGMRRRDVRRLIQAGACWCCEPGLYNDNAAKSRGRRDEAERAIRESKEAA